MQNFGKEIHNKFIKKFNIKKIPGEVDILYTNKTIKYLKYVKWFPGLKMVAIGNSISMNAGTIDSDIDLFIVTSPDSMWVNRILFTIFFQVLNVRKTKNKHAGRFCLSFFATTNGLNFKDWKIEDDIYLYFWIIYLKPILSYDNTYELFINQNKSWAIFDEYIKIINNNKNYIKYK
ncbi:hypothetical protein H3C61_00735 [Candidatus Gracilibacteria bacterium]|nr:hypothetical protein [Candidatus Gracilibacteria bacterium]